MLCCSIEVDISITNLSFETTRVGNFLVSSVFQSPTAVSIDFKTSNGNSIPYAIGSDFEVPRSTAMKYQLFDREFVSDCVWLCKVVSGSVW